MNIRQIHRIIQNILKNFHFFQSPPNFGAQEVGIISQLCGRFQPPLIYNLYTMIFGKLRKWMPMREGFVVAFAENKTLL